MISWLYMIDPKDQIQPNVVSVVSPEPFGEFVQPSGEIRQASVPADMSGHVIPVVNKIPDDAVSLGVSSSANPSIKTFSGVELPGVNTDGDPDTGSAWIRELAISQEGTRKAV